MEKQILCIKNVTLAQCNLHYASFRFISSHCIPKSVPKNAFSNGIILKCWNYFAISFWFHCIHILHCNLNLMSKMDKNRRHFYSILLYIPSTSVLFQLNHDENVALFQNIFRTSVSVSVYICICQYASQPA